MHPARGCGIIYLRTYRYDMKNKTLIFLSLLVAFAAALPVFPQDIPQDIPQTSEDESIAEETPDNPESSEELSSPLPDYTVPALTPEELLVRPPDNIKAMIAVSATGLLLGTGYAAYCGYGAWNGLEGRADDYELQRNLLGISQGMIVAGISGLFLDFFLDRFFPQKPASGRQ